MIKMRKFVFIIIFAFLLIQFSFIYNSVIGAKEDGTFYLKDIAGDRSVMNDIQITGVLTDGYHRTSFSVRENTIKTDTEIYLLP